MQKKTYFACTEAINYHVFKYKKRCELSVFELLLSFYFVRLRECDFDSILCIFLFLFYFVILDIDDCVPNHCEHGATCNDHVNGYSCDCPNGYSGFNCQIGIFSIK